MNDAYPIHEAYRLSDAERQRIFATNILRRFERIKPVTHPTVHFFGAQPGAGKTQAEAVVAAQLHERDGPNSVMAIIGDDLRAYHPQYEQLMVDDDQRAAPFTASDSAWWVEQAIEHAPAAAPARAHRGDAPSSSGDRSQR